MDAWDYAMGAEHVLPVGSHFTVTVANPSYKSRVVARHEGLNREDAAELVAIYRALGYTAFQLNIVAEDLQAA